MTPLRPRAALPTAAGLALGALADVVLGDPRRGHPVAGFGTVAAALERRVWRDSRVAGAGYAAALTGAAVAAGRGVDRLTRDRPLARTAATAVATWTVLGGTSLGRAATTLQASPGRGDLPAARAALPALAGRDPRDLDAAGAGPGHGRVGRREHLRRRGRAAALGRGRRACPACWATAR